MLNGEMRWYPHFLYYLEVLRCQYGTGWKFWELLFFLLNPEEFRPGFVHIIISFSIFESCHFRTYFNCLEQLSSNVPYLNILDHEVILEDNC